MIATIQRFASTLMLTGLALCLIGIVVDLFLDVDGMVVLVAFGIGFPLVVVGLALAFLPGHDHDGRPQVVQSPVRGRWAAINSPASKVPSHGIRAYGQSHAVDLVAEPSEGAQRPVFGKIAGMAPPSDFPAFGQPVHAMVGGTVVTVRDRQRDHRSRTRWWALGVMMIESIFRELRGSAGVIGNQVVIDAGEGVYALVAHLQQGSATVREGDRVAAGEVIARCGNTGNSSEPHVHAQLMDRRNPSRARGLPMEFDGVGMPANGEHLVA